jgi:hypothetical protein
VSGPAIGEPFPYPRSEQENLVTSISTRTQQGGTALPELPPASIAVLAVGTAELLQQAAGLPQPVCVFIYDHQYVSMQFAPAQASMRAITRWALRFGSVMTTQPHQGKDGPETWCRTDFGYFGIAVTAYAHIPDERSGRTERTS